MRGWAAAGPLLGECGRGCGGCGGRVPGRSYLSHGGAAPSAAPAALYRSGGTGRGWGRGGGGKSEGGPGREPGGGGSVPASPNIDGAASRPSQGDGERRGHRRHRGTGGGPGATGPRPRGPHRTHRARSGCAELPASPGPSERTHTPGRISPSRRAPAPPSYRLGSPRRAQVAPIPRRCTAPRQIPPSAALLSPCGGCTAEPPPLWPPPSDPR